jgi:hypothetical protein
MVTVEHQRCPLRHRPRSSYGSRYHHLGKSSWCPFVATHAITMALLRIRAKGTYMRKVTFFVALAFSCFGHHAVYGQVRIVAAGQPTFLVSQSEGTAEVGDSTIPNPFDYFSDEPSDSLSPESLGPDPFGSPRGPALEASPSDVDPSSLSVGRHSRSVVDTIIDHAAIARVQDAGMAPILWTAAPQAPNHVGNWLTRQQCVDGLWDHYPAQRAQECAEMWEHLAGHQRCAGGSCGPCSACNRHARNRYTENRNCGCAQGTCDQFQNCTNCAQRSPALPAPPALPAATVSEPKRDAANGAPRDNVAEAARLLVR